MVTEMFPNRFSVDNLKIAVQKKQMPIQFVFVNEFFLQNGQFKQTKS